MNVSAVDNSRIMEQAPARPTAEALRDAAVKFEALLLNQLTSLLTKTSFDDGDDPEGSLFGSDGGTGLAKQLFAEQLASTMAQAGGLGLANVILKQFGIEPSPVNAATGLQTAANAVRSIREGGETVKPLINRSISAEPIERPTFAGNAGDAEVISTFEEQARSEGIEESLRNLVLDGRIVNTTRARIAPNAPVNDITPINAAVGAAEKLEYQFPVAGRLSSDFGNRIHPIDKKVKFHAGLDLAVNRGTSVEASATGVVSFAGRSGGYGNLVVIQHSDGRETRYAHLERPLVAEGDRVAAGQQIGLSGSTGRSTGPHLHFEIRENGKVLNPLSILTKGLR